MARITHILYIIDSPLRLNACIDEETRLAHFAADTTIKWIKRVTIQ